MPLGEQAVHHLFPDKTVIAERPIEGRYWLQKWDPQADKWISMSAGNGRPEAGPGRELDHFKRQGRVIGGKVRIIQNSPGGHTTTVVWEHEGSR